MRNLFYCKDEKIYQYVYIILIILSFIPLFIISFYAHPSADDYSYSIETYRLWSETNNIVVLLKAAYNETVSSWNTWQGLYSSAFLLSLQPAIYGESWYCLTGIIMLSLLIGGNLVVCLYFTTKFLGAMKLEAIVLGLSISFLAIHWMPAISEGVYWYNGAINYGFFYFVLQLCICALVEYTCCKKKEKEIIYFLISSLLVFVLEGGNHVTAFIGLLFTFFLLLIAFISKRKEKIIGLFAVSVVGIGGFLLNVMSPGTRIRAGAIGDAGLGVVDTIYMALRQVVFDIREWIGVNTVVVLLCVFPILVRLAKEIRNNSGFTFKYPVLLPVFSVLILGAMYCPPFFAMGMAGDGRLIDIVYYSFTLLLFVCVFYFTGWLLGKFDNDKICVKTNGIMIIVFSVLIYISMVSGWSWGGVATSELCEGVPQAYSQQAYQRDVLFRQSEGTDLEIEMFNDISEVIFFRDITEDESFWRNKALARYYNLNSIRLDTDNE